MHDVIIIGGGLSGCFSAIQLAKAGLKVLVIEEHPRTGDPRYCTGIIGREAFDRFELPLTPIQDSYSSAIFYSPLGSYVRVSQKSVQAYILNRAEFDNELAQMALFAGADFFYSTRCTHLESDPNHITLTLQEKSGLTREIKGKTAILSSGTYYGLHPKLGLSRPSQYLDTAQVEVDARGIMEVEVYFGRDVAPGSFAWASPLPHGRARIGLSTYRNAKYHLNQFLDSKTFKGRLPKQPIHIKRKVIPIQPLEKSYGKRFLIIGDAAGQVKPTTGGGIYYGLLSAWLASQNIIEAFQKEIFEERHFALYQEAWKKEIGKELKIGSLTRKMLRHITDHQIDSLIRFLQRKESLELIKKHADFDWHQNIILALSKDPSFWLSLSKHLLGIKAEVITPTSRKTAKNL